MNTKILTEAIKAILTLTLPFIKQLIESKVVPFVKRKAYEKFDGKGDKLIADLAQNASKIKDEENPVKKAAYIEGTRLGVEMLRAMSDKLKKAADEIEKAVSK